MDDLQLVWFVVFLFGLAGISHRISINRLFLRVEEAERHLDRLVEAIDREAKRRSD